MLDHFILAISLILFAVIALGAFRTIIDTKIRSLKGWSSETNQAYLALTITTLTDGGCNFLQTPISRIRG
jgi:hypothetical protein